MSLKKNTNNNGNNNFPLKNIPSFCKTEEVHTFRHQKPITFSKAPNKTPDNFFFDLDPPFSKDLLIKNKEIPSNLSKSEPTVDMGEPKKNIENMNGENFLKIKLESSEASNNRGKTNSNNNLIKFLILNKTANLLLKIRVIFQKFFLSHFFAIIILTIKTEVQRKVDAYCWFDLCFCNDDWNIKIYSVVSDFFSFWVLYIILISKTITSVHLFDDLKIKILIHILCSVFIILLSLLLPEKEYNTMYVYLFLCVISLAFYSFYLHFLKFAFLKWVKNLMKINSLIVLIFANHYILKYYIGSFFEKINDALPEFWSKNIIFLIVAGYCKFMVFASKKLLLIYYRLLIIERNRDPLRSLVSICRYILCFIVSFNVSGLLKMESHDVGGWVLILFYTIFVFSAYIPIDVFSILWNKVKQFLIKKCCCPLKSNIKTQKNNLIIRFERVFSGAMLDVILICTFRLLAWYIGRHWITWFYNSYYYQDCTFEIKSTFLMTTFGLTSIITVNISITILILVYMLKKKIVFFEYKIRNYTAYNSFYLILLHTFFEANLLSVNFMIQQSEKK